MTELIAAMNDVEVDHILVVPQSDYVWNITEEEWPEAAVVVSSRTLVLEGKGNEPVYVDVSVLLIMWVNHAWNGLWPAAPSGKAGNLTHEQYMNMHAFCRTDPSP